MSEEVKAGEDEITTGTEADKGTSEFDERVGNILDEVLDVSRKTRADAPKSRDTAFFKEEAIKFLRFDHDLSRYHSTREAFIAAIVQLVLAIEGFDLRSDGC